MTIPAQLDHYQQKLARRARRVLPGGVNSPVRSFAAVDLPPLHMRRARGCEIEDVEGRRYTDYIGSWGVFALGHAHPEVASEIEAAVRDGTAFGVTCEAEIQLAEEVCSRVPSVESVRFVNSGTEAVMSALRLARGLTGRPLIVKFAGCYHGHSDGLLVRSGSGPMTLGVPDSAGVPSQVAGTTLLAPYNDAEATERLFRTHGDAIAAVVLEPVAGNMGVVPPRAGFLEALRELSTRHGALLVFDEVMTGFRVSRGGAQQRFHIEPDLTCLGKILGGGLPIGAFGGSRRALAELAPLGPVYQAGTMSGNPLAMRAGLATLRQLDDHAYRRLETLGAQHQDVLSRGLARFDVRVQRVGSMLSVFFHDEPVEDLETVHQSRTNLFKKLFAHLLKHDILVPPSPFEAWFVSLAHGQRELQRLEQALLSFDPQAAVS